LSDPNTGDYNRKLWGIFNSGPELFLDFCVRGRRGGVFIHLKNILGTLD